MPELMNAQLGLLALTRHSVPRWCPKVTFGERWLTWRKDALVTGGSGSLFDPRSWLTGHELQQWPGQSQPEYKSYLRCPTYVTASCRSLMSSFPWLGKTPTSPATKKPAN